MHLVYSFSGPTCGTGGCHKIGSSHPVSQAVDDNYPSKEWVPEYSLCFFLLLAMQPNRVEMQMLSQSLATHYPSSDRKAPCFQSKWEIGQLRILNANKQKKPGMTPYTLREEVLVGCFTHWAVYLLYFLLGNQGEEKSGKLKREGYSRGEKWQALPVCLCNHTPQWRSVWWWWWWA